MTEELRVGPIQTEKDVRVAIELIERKINELIRLMEELKNANQ